MPGVRRGASLSVFEFAVYSYGDGVWVDWYGWEGLWLWLTIDDEDAGTTAVDTCP